MYSMLMEEPNILAATLLPVSDDKSVIYREFKVRCLQATSLVGPLLVMSLQLLMLCILFHLSACGHPRWKRIVLHCGLCWYSVYKAVLILLAVVTLTWIFTALYLNRQKAALTLVVAALAGVIIGNVADMVAFEISVSAAIPIDIFSWTAAIWNVAITSSYILTCPWIGGGSLLKAVTLLLAVSGALLILCLDEATAWIFMALMIVWDVYAVAHPRGPIHLMLEQRRHWVYMGEHSAGSIPGGLVYSTRYFELGTMDLVFLGVIVGRGAISGGYCTLFACVPSVLVGFMATCLHAMASRSTVPALPLALSVGIATYAFCTTTDIQGMVSKTARRGVYF